MEVELERTRAQVVELEEARAQASREWEGRVGEVERAMGTEAEARQIETDALRREKAALEAQAAEALERARVLEGENARMEARQIEGEAELAQVRAQVESLTENITRNEAVAREREAAALASHAAQALEAVETWRTRAEAAEHRAVTCEQLRRVDDKAQANAEREEWHRLRVELEATIGRLQLELQSSWRTLPTPPTPAEATKTDRRRMELDEESELERVRAELDDATHENDALRQRVAELEATVTSSGEPKEEDELLSQIRAISRVKRQLQSGNELSDEEDDGKAEAKRRARQRIRARRSWRRGVASAATQFLWTLLFVLIVAVAILLLRIDFVTPWEVPT
jgi:hypothetical protein